ncbi:nucleotidyl transferase AbiEii/AbiGii toxin family protein [Actinocatenispora rupis]|uniref:Nucleotidyl transferase AbiEii toxin, Type IV TA system n=1 Tax=Actinocatenispora rupis TaxID=519421 RepID=A0A8J3NAV6_9ACTN|nr:nucleotidyl transferase AbiEii/AbiGii toxin family protein [Actinocatenispora rupis]GID12486.1 hypothetical protein Aru02nite_33750 [Actinocatenispora rupis]
MTDDAQRAAHRAALDHVLGLCAGRWWSDSVVLRGSVLLPTWLGAAARPPADLDWVVIGTAHDPEAVADRTYGWEYPDGSLADLCRRYPEIEQQPGDDEPGWYVDRELDVAPAAPFGDLLDLLVERPRAARGVVLCPAEAEISDDWAYSGYDGVGVRLVIPWRAPGLPDGSVQLDFAADERVPETPVPTLVPRADGGPPAVVLAVSRELALAWKVLWMYRDTRAYGWYDDGEDEPAPAARGKDLYDAVLLAEGCRTSELPRLLRDVFGDEDIALDDLVSWPVDWAEFVAAHPWVTGTAREWSERLAAALPPLSDIPPYSPIPPRDLAALADHWNSARS